MAMKSCEKPSGAMRSLSVGRKMVHFLLHQSRGSLTQTHSQSSYNGSKWFEAILGYFMSDWILACDDQS